MPDCSKLCMWPIHPRFMLLLVLNRPYCSRNRTSEPALEHKRVHMRQQGRLGALECRQQRRVVFGVDDSRGRLLVQRRAVRAAERLLPRFKLEWMQRERGLLADVHWRKAVRPAVDGLNVPPERKRALGVLRPQTLYSKIDHGRIGLRIRVESKQWQAGG
jgi:hypothetical protein